LPQTALVAESRPVGTSLVQPFALVLQQGPCLHGDAARLSAAGLPAGANGLERLARTCSSGGAPGLAGLAAGRRDGLSRRLQDRAQRRELERHRRRLLGRRWRRADLGG